MKRIHVFVLSVSISMCALVGPAGRADAAPATTPPSEIVLDESSGESQSLDLAWSEGFMPSGSYYAVRGQAGQVPPAPDTGTDFGRSDAPYLTIPSMPTNDSYTFAVWAVDPSGALLGPATLTVNPSKFLDVRFTQRIHVRGPVVITGRLVDAVTSKPVSGARIASRIERGSSSTTGGYATTAADGSFRVVQNHSQGASYVLHASIPGSSPFNSGTVLGPLLVRPNVYGGLSSFAVRRGGILRAYATTSPVRARLVVTLQEQVGGKWRMVAKAKTDRTGTARWRLRPRSVGVHRYRMAFPPSRGYIAARTGVYSTRVR